MYYEVLTPEMVYHALYSTAPDQWFSLSTVPGTNTVRVTVHVYDTWNDRVPIPHTSAGGSRRPP